MVHLLFGINGKVDFFRQYAIMFWKNNGWGNTYDKYERHVIGIILQCAYIYNSYVYPNFVDVNFSYGKNIETDAWGTYFKYSSAKVSSIYESVS